MDKLNRIRELLEDRNLTKVAPRVGITRVYLTYIKNGQATPSESLQTKLLDYLEGRTNESK
jgi:transcriptional regulator with XRE-family HTH domain